MIYNKTYFMIGVGGIGMSAIALHLIENGASVWGYDKVKSPITHMLSDVGVHIIYAVSYTHLTLPTKRIV